MDNIITKMREVQNRFEEYRAAIIQEEENKKVSDANIAAYTVEVNKLQGAYSVLLQIGQEVGIVNEKGEIIEAAPVAEPVVETPAKPASPQAKAKKA